MPARVLNMVVVVDGEFRGEIENRLERVGRYHPSRLVLVRGRAGAAQARRVGADRHRGRAEAGPDRGRARARRAPIGERHLRQARHDRRPAAGHRPGDDGVGAARPRRGGRRAAAAGADRAVDSQDEPDVARRARARRRPRRATPTSSTSRGCARRRGASASRPRSTRRALRRGAAARSRRSPSATARTRWPPALLFCGWLASRLGWKPGALVAARRRRWRGHARARRQDVTHRARAGRAWTRPGSAGVTIEIGLGRGGLARPRARRAARGAPRRATAPSRRGP